MKSGSRIHKTDAIISSMSHLMDTLISFTSSVFFSLQLKKKNEAQIKNVNVIKRAPIC